ncbi:MAG: hypothetical protein M2R45_00552 [Verrucomicrobia subdivision 3 bacterium]|nr:hypothetical protein [Limisphaerales bacterium]MCS1413570.1 hypothetical protein [Limisphaerales bacterium]
MSSSCSHLTTLTSKSPWQLSGTIATPLVAKPLVKTVEEHRQLIAAAKEYNIPVDMEIHKR